ncbi:MAG TPA: hypothetical protein VIF43_01990 [Patescibacteria group bacterium]|jgi:hypothetical protein
MSSKRFKTIALLGLVLSIALAGTAQAEQCSEDGKICLVTDVSQPTTLPKSLEFRVVSEAQYFDLTEPVAEYGGFTGPSLVIRSVTPVEQGPPGGMSRWVADLGPTDEDYTFTMVAIASGPTTQDEVGRLSFPLSTLGSVNNLQTRIVRTKKQFVAIVSYEGRTTIKNEFDLTLGAREGGRLVGNPKKKRKVVELPALPAGNHHVIRLVINRKAVQRLCREYKWCGLSMGVQQSVPYYDPIQGRMRAIEIPWVVGKNGANRVVKKRA